MPELNKKLDLSAAARPGRRGARWRWAALIAALALGCKNVPDQWIGVDRAAVSCEFATWNRATCVGLGRVYTCVRESGSSIWNCAEQHPAAPTAEAGTL